MTKSDQLKFAGLCAVIVLLVTQLVLNLVYPEGERDNRNFLLAIGVGAVVGLMLAVRKE